MYVHPHRPLPSLDYHRLALHLDHLSLDARTRHGARRRLGLFPLAVVGVLLLGRGAGQDVGRADDEECEYRSAGEEGGCAEGLWVQPGRHCGERRRLRRAAGGGRRAAGVTAAAAGLLGVGRLGNTNSRSKLG